MKSRRGAGHLEMIIAFSLFILFVLFLMLYIRPYDDSGLQDSLFLGFHSSFVEEVEVSFTRIFFKPDSSDCFSFDFGSEYSDLILGEYVVLDRAGSMVGSEISGTVVTVDSSSDSFYILLAEGLESEILGSCSLSLVDGEVGSVVTKDIVSDKKLGLLESDYESSYDSLKQRFGIPEAVDFGVSIVGEDYELEGLVPEGVDVMAKIYVHEVLMSDGSIENKEFVLKIW